MLRIFFTWWVSQLLELLPASLRRFGPESGDATIVEAVPGLDSEIEAIAFTRRRNGRETILTRVGKDSEGAAAVVPIGGRTTILRVRATQVLAKTVTLPIAAERDLGQVLAFEMDRETPFTSGELYWTYRLTNRNRQNGRLTIRLLLMPRISLASLLEIIAKLGIVPRHAEIGDGPDAGCRLPLDGLPGTASPSRSRLFWPAAACCAALAIAAIVVPFIQQGLQLAALDQEIAANRAKATEAQNLRQEIERVSGSVGLVASERIKAGRMLQVLAALTQTLADDTYLTEMSFRQKKLTLTGRSAAAAPLIEALAARREFRDPAFAAPVTRVESPRSELFTITAAIAP